MKGRWLAGSVIALVFAIAFFAAGVWQLDRNQEKHDKSRRAQAAYAAPAPLLGATSPPADTRVEAHGTFDTDPAHETLLRDQLHKGRAGVDVLTPLQLGDGTAVIVNRGSVGLDASVPPPPAGAVIVRGLAHTARANDAQSAPERQGQNLSLASVDLGRIGATVPYRLREVWIEAQYLNPAAGASGPALPQPPPVDQVNHMEYAIQWFAFALIPLVGWPFLMWRRARRRPAPAAN